MPERGGKERRVSALLTGVTISPREVPLEGGERVVVTFPKEEKVPEASIFLVFTGEGVPNIRRTEKINEHTVAAIAPGYATEGQVKLEVLYSVQDTTVVLFRDRITYSREAPRTSQHSTGMGASQSASGEDVDLKEAPQGDQGHKGGGTSVTGLLTECVQCECVGPLSSAMVEELRTSLRSLSHDDLVKVDCEAGTSLGQGSQPANMSLDNWKESPAETTLLHVLAEFGMMCVVQNLIHLPGKSLAAIRLDQNGHMPEEVATAQGHHQLAQLLVQCRQELPCREREAQASSTSSLEGDWSTLTIRAKKKSDKTVVRVASCGQGQLTKVSMEQDSFTNMKAELGDQDPGGLANGEVHAASLKCEDSQKSTAVPASSGDTSGPPCSDSGVGGGSREAARITGGESPVISVHVPGDDGAVSSSDSNNSCDASTSTLPAAARSAQDLPSDGEGTATPTPDNVPPGSQWRSSSIPSPDLVPLGGSVYPPSVNAHNKEKWRRSKSWSAVDNDDPSHLWDEEEEEEEDLNAPPALALDLIDGPLSITSGSYESSSEEENERENVEHRSSDTDEFASAKEEFANSPALHRAKPAKELGKEGSTLVDERPGEGGSAQQDSSPGGDVPLLIVGDSESSDLANSLGSLPTDTSSDSKGGSLHPQAPQGAVSIESDMNQLSDLNVSDVDVSVGSVGEGGLDDSLSRDRGKSDPLPYSIAAAREEIEVSRSHEVLLASTAQATPTIHIPVIEENQPADECSPVAKQPTKRKSSKSKTNLGISSLSHSCDSGFESNISRNPSNISDSSPTALAGVRRSHSARGPSSTAEHLRTSRTSADMSSTTHQCSTDELRDNNTLPMPDRSQRSPSPAPYNLQGMAGLASTGVEEDDEDPPIMYQTSVEQVVRERKLLQTSPKHQDHSSPSEETTGEDGERQKKSSALLVSPTRSRPLRRSTPADTSTPHHLETAHSSSAIPPPPEGETSPDGGRRGSIRSMLIQPSQSMNFHVDMGASAEVPADSGSTLAPLQYGSKEEPPAMRKRSGPHIERATRASISLDRPSQHSSTAQHRMSLAVMSGSHSGSHSASHSVSSCNEDQVSRVSSATTILEEGEHESSALEEEEEEEEEGSGKYNLSSYPELAVQQPTVWSHTVSKKTMKKLNQSERDRQALLFEWVQTERNHYRTLILLDYGFRKSMKEKAGLSEEQLQVMFPVLESLVAISKEFTRDLMDRQEDGKDGIMDSISDLVLAQFSGQRAEKMVRAFGEFASRQVYIVENFKEHMKGKKFRRVMNDCYKDPAVQRRKFPDLVQGVTSRISKYVSLMDNLLKESQRCKVDDLADVIRAKELVTKVVEEVEKTVKDKTSLMELENLQSKLEIHIPKSTVRDDKERKELKALKFTASHRRLLRNGRAIWLGSHQKQLDVYLVLVTDFIVFLAEANGKYNIAFLQDFQPPVIRLVDIHVRVDAASKVQLLLMTKSRPEIFKLKFKNHIECERWESAVMSAVEICKQEGFACKSFAGDSWGGEESTPKVAVEADSLPVDPKEKMLFEANQRLAAARKLLDRARFKDKPHIGVQRAGSLAAADRPSKFLSHSPRMDSQKGGLVGARNRPERKTFGPKAKLSQSEEVPTEYILCLSNMAESVQHLLSCIEKQDTALAKLNEQLSRARAGGDGHKTSTTSIESESNLDWGDRPLVSPMNTVIEEVDGAHGSLMQSFSQDGGVAMARTSSSNLCAPVRHTVGTGRRPRSFHEESSSEPL